MSHCNLKVYILKVRKYIGDFFVQWRDVFSWAGRHTLRDRDKDKEWKIKMNIYYFLLTDTLNFLRALATLTARCPIIIILATPVRTTYPYSLDSTTIVTLERIKIKQIDGVFGYRHAHVVFIQINI